MIGCADEARHDVTYESWDRPRRAWLLSTATRDPHERVLLLELTARALFPTILVFSVYLVLAGHYEPGGGFAGGLVAGLAFVLRYLAGGGAEIEALLPVRPPAVFASGLAITLVTALVPMAFGAPALWSAKAGADLPLLGHVEFQTSVFFDAGVYLLIVGVLLDLLRTIGEGIERDIREAGKRT